MLSDGKTNNIASYQTGHSLSVLGLLYLLLPSLVILKLKLLSADFFFHLLFQKILSGSLSECQMVWIQIRTDILSVLIWVQTVCKCYQQKTMPSLARKESRVNGNPILCFIFSENEGSIYAIRWWIDSC